METPVNFYRSSKNGASDVIEKYSLLKMIEKSSLTYGNFCSLSKNVVINGACDVIKSVEIALMAA